MLRKLQVLPAGPGSCPYLALSCRQKACSGTTCYLGSLSCSCACCLQGLARLLQPQDEAVDFGLVHLALQLSGDGLVLRWEQELQAIIEPGAVNMNWPIQVFQEPAGKGYDKDNSALFSMSTAAPACPGAVTLLQRFSA